jgi:light-regulated signal transduction histidine kinase (bacteriophytochrome)
LQEALKSLEPAIRESAGQVRAKTLPSVKASGTHLQLVFQNLVGNALKYRSPERPPVVQIEAQRQDGSCLFSVRDNGIGIESQYAERIFGVFKRLHTTDQYPGTGIGLAICKRIVERYHGRIWVESRPGEGSDFYFTLPG